MKLQQEVNVRLENSVFHIVFLCFKGGFYIKEWMNSCSGGLLQKSMNRLAKTLYILVKPYTIWQKSVVSPNYISFLENMVFCQKVYLEILYTFICS